MTVVISIWTALGVLPGILDLLLLSCLDQYEVLTVDAGGS